MTSEQIAEIREIYAGKSSSEAQLFVRLLDEREALEKALVGLEVWVTKNVSIMFDTERPEEGSIPALATARRVLDEVCR